MSLYTGSQVRVCTRQSVQVHKPFLRKHLNLGAELKETVEIKNQGIDSVLP